MQLLKYTVIIIAKALTCESNWNNKVLWGEKKRWVWTLTQILMLQRKVCPWCHHCPSPPSLFHTRLYIPSEVWCTLRINSSSSKIWQTLKIGHMRWALFRKYILQQPSPLLCFDSSSSLFRHIFVFSLLIALFPTWALAPWVLSALDLSHCSSSWADSILGSSPGI